VQPPLPKPMYEYSGSLIVTPPLGLGYIASRLRQDGLSVETVDMAILDLDLVELRAGGLNNWFLMVFIAFLYF